LQRQLTQKSTDAAIKAADEAKRSNDLAQKSDSASGYKDSITLSFAHKTLTAQINALKKCKLKIK
jgi:hypothetical protein